MKKVIRAPAKINLCLKVNAKREDGYHDLTSIMQEISLFDTMEIEIVKKKTFFYKKNSKDEGRQINIKCNYPYLPTDERNLVVKITRYFFDKYGIDDNIYIFLKKMIPMSGGLGGGSSDAANMLLYLNSYYKLNLDINELNRIAAMFGSDIPFFLHKKVSLCEGRGEIVTELKPFNNYYILIATPNVRVSTKEIFEHMSLDMISKELERKNSEKLEKVLFALNKHDIKMLTENLFNDLELVTEQKFEKVRTFKERIRELGALTSLMSGSGPTVFGIFNSYIKAINCKSIMKKENYDSFIFIAKPI